MTADLSWQDTAACRDQPPDLFFSEATYDLAKAVCATCDHTDTCLAYALELGCTDGVYGGTSPRQRSKIARTRRRDSLATCAICKGTFWARSGAATLCSDDCRRVHHAQRNKRYREGRAAG